MFGWDRILDYSVWFGQDFGLFRVWFGQDLGLFRVWLDRILDYSGFGLDRFHCTFIADTMFGGYLIYFCPSYGSLIS